MANNPNSRAVGASIHSLSMSKLALCLIYVLLTQRTFIEAQCTTFPCTQPLAIYGAAPPPIVDYTPTESPKETPIETPIAPPPSITPSKTPPSITPVEPSITPSVTPSVKPSVTPSSTPLEEPSITPTVTPSVKPSSTEEIPSTLSTSTPPKNARLGSLTPPKSSASSGKSSLPQFGNTTSGGTTTRIPLPTYQKSSGIAQPTITKAPTLNSTHTNSTGLANSTSSSQCGQCSVMAEQVQVFYWPTASVKTNCARASAVTAFQSGPTYAANATTYANKTGDPQNGHGSIDVVDGFT